MADPIEGFSLSADSNFSDIFMTIPGRCCVGRPLNGVFSAKNSMAVHGMGDLQHTNERTDYISHVVINEVILRKEYACGIIRKLVNEMSGVFLTNQRAPEQPMTVDEILHYSRSYRAVIKLSIEETQKALVTQTEGVEVLEDLMRSLVVSESAWSFAEIIYFQQPHGGELLGQLLLWLQSHVNDCQLMMEELLKETQIESHHNYWPAVLGCLLQGRIQETVHLLQAANNTSQSWIQTIHALNQMPLFQTTGTTIIDFQMKWQHWQREVKHLIEQGVFCDKMIQLTQILAGDLNTMQSTVDELSLPWYSLLLAEILYRQPYARLHHVQDILNECVSQSGGTTAFDTHDHLILSILKKNIIDVMKYSSEDFDSWWFAVHFADVIHQAGYIREKNSVGTSIRESLLLEYGSSLMQDGGLWPVGARYLENCHSYGGFYLQEYLTRVSLTSSKKALKVLKLCEQFGFTQQAASICRVMARRELNENRLGSALTWCRHGKDGNMATIVAERFLDQYRDQMYSTTDVLDALGSTMLLMSKNLLFLAKLREFHQLCDGGEEKEACALLVTLISSRMAPVKYWFLLLLELLPMLDSDKELFTSSQIYDLMNALSELKQSKSSHIINDVERNRVETLQLSLSRSLAKTIVCDRNALMGITNE